MSERQFLEAATKARTANAIRAIEAQTAVEVVVAVRRQAGRYLASCLGFGVVCAAAGFLVMWFSPRVYDVRTMPLDVVLAFLLGTVVALGVPGLRRAITPRQRLELGAQRAAREAFSALGIEKTRGRTGLLVYVTLFERTAVLVPDRGIPETAVAESRSTLASAVSRLDLEAFFGALARLGPAFATVLPRSADDENELCDDVA
jgi:putative membrane protein